MDLIVFELNEPNNLKCIGHNLKSKAIILVEGCGLKSL